jgi:hypothetical protein
VVRSLLLQLGGGALVLAAVAAGCSASGNTVTGKVKYKGATLPEGRVAFLGKEGSASGPIQPDGSYTIKMAPLGKVAITVNTSALDPSSLPDAGLAAVQARGMIPKVETPTVGGTPAASIPRKYGRPETSGLTFTVKPGKQNYDINLD